MNFGVGFVFAIYVLLQKEKLASQCKQLCYAVLKEEKADEVVRVGKLADRIFSSFLSGQVVEAIILGTMFFIAMSIFKFPYAMLVGVLIAVTALIPIFGAFIGLGIGAFLILMVDPMQALWFVVMFFVLQQIEGNLIYPNVVGNSIGLPGIWVLIAVSTGGSMFGVKGMLLFIPMFSLIYTLVREYVKKRLIEKGVESKKWRVVYAVAGGNKKADDMVSENQKEVEKNQETGTMSSREESREEVIEAKEEERIVKEEISKQGSNLDEKESSQMQKKEGQAGGGKRKNKSLYKNKK